MVVLLVTNAIINNASPSTSDTAIAGATPSRSGDPTDPLPSAVIATYAPRASIRPPVTLAPGTPATGISDRTFPVGSWITISEDGREVGRLRVIEFERSKFGVDGVYLAPGDGNVFYSALLEYEATRGNMDYGGFGFTARDQDDYVHEARLIGGREPELGSGTLNAGRKARGWVTFEVPEGTKHLVIGEQNLFGGSLIWEVALF